MALRPLEVAISIMTVYLYSYFVTLYALSTRIILIPVGTAKRAFPASSQWRSLKPHHPCAEFG